MPVNGDKRQWQTSASLFYLSFRSQETGESKASCLWSLLLLKRQKSKWQGNLKTTQHTRNPRPPPLQQSLFEKQSANKQMKQPVRKGRSPHTRDPDTSHDLHMHSGSCIKCSPSTEWRSFRLYLKKRQSSPQEGWEEALSVIFLIQLQLIHRMRWSQPSIMALKIHCLLKRFCPVFATPLYNAHHLFQPFPYLLTQTDPSHCLTLSFHTSHSQFLLSSARELWKVLLQQVSSSVGGILCP